MYTQYVSNHDRATEFLKELESNHSKFQSFIQKASADPRSKNLSLASYLITPIQRVPRYLLLLNEFLRNTESNHADCEGLKKAIDLVQGVAKHINDEIKMQENRAKIVKIQAEFADAVTFVSPSRRFLRQGILTKRCRASDKPYTFFLFNDLLVYASKPLTGLKGYKLHKQIPVDAAFNVEDIPPSDPDAVAKTAEAGGAAGAGGVDINPAENFRFQILNSQKSFVVYTNDLKSKQEWLEDFSSVLKEATQRLKKSAVAGVEKKADFIVPVWKANSASNCCDCCSTNFTFTNRRHHCRKCGALVCNSCSKKRMIIKGDQSKSPQRVCDKCVEEITVRQRGKSEAETAPSAEGGVAAEGTDTPKEGGEGAGAGGGASTGPGPSFNSSLIAAMAAISKAAASRATVSYANSHEITITSSTQDGDDDDDDDDDSSIPSNPSSPTPASPSSFNSFSFPAGRPSRPPPVPSSLSKPRPPPPFGYCKAVYSYNPQDTTTDLKLNEGSVIAIYSKDGDWWKGVIVASDGSYGGADESKSFPANYCMDAPTDNSSVAESNSKIDLMTEAIQSYTKKEDIELSFEIGDRIHIKNKDGLARYYGQNQRTQQWGWLLKAHVAHVKEISTNNSNPASPFVTKASINNRSNTAPTRALPLPSSLSNPPASTACSECDCSSFKKHLFKPTVCQCQHKEQSHNR